MLGSSRPLDKLLYDGIRPAEFQRLVGQLGIKLFPHTVVSVYVGMDIVDKWSYSSTAMRTSEVGVREEPQRAFCLCFIGAYFVIPVGTVLGRKARASEVLRVLQLNECCFLSAVDRHGYHWFCGTVVFAICNGRKDRVVFCERLCHVVVDMYQCVAVPVAVVINHIIKPFFILELREKIVQRIEPDIGFFECCYLFLIPGPVWDPCRIERQQLGVQR